MFALVFSKKIVGCVSEIKLGSLGALCGTQNGVHLGPRSLGRVQHNLNGCLHEMQG